MCIAWGDLDAFTCGKCVAIALDLHRQFTFKNIEELSRVDMMMADFACAWWHSFFNHTQLRHPHQVPPIAAIAP